MSERPTPETDAFLRDLNDYSDVELRAMTDHARKLERERDEATTRRMETIMQCELYEQERDEARKALMKIEDLFIDGTDIYADRENMGIIARNALEGAK
jgi:selenocysteine lyase/cysteine desulfurase